LAFTHIHTSSIAYQGDYRSVPVYGNPYQGKGFTNAGSMANPKRKVHKGTWPTEIKQDGVYVTFHTLICTSRQQEKTYFVLVGSNLSGLKTSGSTKCSGIWHIAPVDIWKIIPHCYLQVYIY